MASTTLFAPQVVSTQPAFIYGYEQTKDKVPNSSKQYYQYSSVNKRYEKTAKPLGSFSGIGSVGYYEFFGALEVQYDISSLNELNDIKNKYLLYSIKDPNQMAGWGSNFMFKQSENDTSVEVLRYVKIPSSISSKSNLKLSLFLSEDNFKTFTHNQYYQVQLYFADITETDLPTGNSNIITQSWVKEHEGKISDPSQVTLIRPIESLDVRISMTADFSKLTGYIFGADEEEPFNSYYCTFTGGNIPIGDVWMSPFIWGSGTEFEIPIDNSIVTEGEGSKGDYDITFFYTTLHGYSSSVSDTESYSSPGTSEDVGKISATSIPDKGAIEIALTANKIIEGSKIQRSDEYIPGYWKTLYTHNGAELETFNWIDNTVESGKTYKYRLIAPYGGIYQTNDSQTEVEAKVSFDDILLSDSTAMVAIRFNPNITGFKYVTQESITNTLGGKYPIIRKNGDTKYCQFNLSGMIDSSIRANSQTVIGSVSNATPPTDGWWYGATNGGSLYLTDINKLGILPTASNLEAEKREVIEKNIRRLTMDFLTNGQPKLFRSFEEGNMIVYLSNISFTPNKTLGRHIYDFSATVTEMCEYTTENLQKYKLNIDNYTQVAEMAGGSS